MICSGIGYDVHRLVAGRLLVLGGEGMAAFATACLDRAG